MAENSGNGLAAASMNVLIIGAQPGVRAGLAELCDRRDEELCVLEEVPSGARAIQAAEALRPDLLLLDAELPDMSGFDVLRALRPRHRRRTVLVTANSRDAAPAFAAGALDYLMKPVSVEALSTSIVRARERFRSRIMAERRALRVTEPAPVRADGEYGRPLFLIGEREHRLYPLEARTIDYIEADGNYVKYVLGDAEYIARESIKHLAAILCPGAGFVRIERSLMLNVRAIVYAEPIGHGTFAFILRSGTRLHSGPAYRDTILDALPLRRRAAKRTDSQTDRSAGRIRARAAAHA